MKKKIIAAVVLLLAAGGTVGTIVAVRSHRAEFVRETLSRLSQAEEARRQGKFDEAARISEEAAARHEQNRGWFEPAEAERVKEAAATMAAELAIWNKVLKTPADPAAARRHLESLAGGGGTSGPLAERIAPRLAEALRRELEGTRAQIDKQIAEGLSHYEKGAWKDLAEAAGAARRLVEDLPTASQSQVVGLPKELYDRAELAARIYTVSADGPWGADGLRDLLEGLAEPKGRDGALRKEILSRIDALDKETRPALELLQIPEQGRRHLTEAFAKGGELEVLPGEEIRLRGPRHAYRIGLVGPGPQVLIETDRVRLTFAVGLVNNRERAALETAGRLARALRATRHERILADAVWEVVADAPGLCAAQVAGSRAWVYLEGRIFEGKATAEEPDLKEKVSTFLQRAKALTAAVRDSSSVPAELKGPLGAFLAAAYTRAPPNDYLEGEFCREAIHAGYLEEHLPGMEESIREKLRQYKESYEEVTRHRLRISGRAPDNSLLERSVNLEGESVWRLVDLTAGTTTFSAEPRDSMRTSLIVHVEFPGAKESWPAEDPSRVRMFHPTAGEIAVWNSSDGKLNFDPERWSRALRGDDPPDVPEHYGKGDWRVPPHALIVDSRGRTRALILPAGMLRPAPFSGPKKREDQERFLDECAKSLRTPGELHLFMRYLVQYVLDSPVTTDVTLIGSSKHTGEVHQDVHQTLDRWMSGRYLADCDDLAEVYQEILKRQGRLAYVLGVPGHATCGLAEKDGSDWVFSCVDTGPPRQLRGPDLDATLEKVVRTYDRDGSMAFDPRSVRFLFRFAGEQTRTDYYLDSRMFRDAEYAELMIRVQECWHFAFYADGIETMNRVLKTDTMPANCAEIAGLYTQVGMYEEALRWSQKGVSGLDPRDTLSRLSELMRQVHCLRELKRRGEELKLLRGAADEIEAIVRERPEEADRTRRIRFEVAAALGEAGDPWRGWALAGPECRGRLTAEPLAGLLTAIYLRMRETESPTAEQSKQIEELGRALEGFCSAGLFRADDSIHDVLRKYGALFFHYAARDGWDKAGAELLKREFATARRRHDDRRGATAEEDWRWIRLSPFSYGRAAGRELEKENKRAGGPKAALPYLKALESALPEIRKQGSLGTVEFMVLDLQLLRALLEMDEPSVRAVFAEMKRQSWGRLTEDLARTLGRTAEHMSAEYFERIFRLFCEHAVPRRHYYGVVYSALEGGAVRHALAASKICREKFPADADMAREHELLLKLAAQSKER
jgi:hypothetical protein